MVLIQENLQMGVYLLKNPDVDDLYDVIGLGKDCNPSLVHE
jgi:hypothetical protein